MKLIVELAGAGADVSYYDPLIPALEADGRYYEHTLEPDPGAYELVVLATIHPRVEYGWLADCERVLDCTYRTPGGRSRHVI